jgi:GNAT superfamily N-acetyltransferase
MDIRLATTDEEITEAHTVMKHLRDVDRATFLKAVRVQEGSGYRIVSLYTNNGPVAVAGFRISQNLAWRRHLYIDDLVTLPEARSTGYGAALVDWLLQLAKDEGCQEVHLDSGVERKDAHRFYEREGFHVSSLHFKRVL